jgi:hypothetical protein
MNINLIIEIKKEYETMLCDILVPFIYEGFTSIFIEANKISKNNNSLKTFQTLLMKIKDWNINILIKELNNLQTRQSTPQWFEKLVKTVFKINMLILSLEELPEHMLNDITILKFLHQIYKECAKKFWMNPFLFSDKVSPIESNQNRILAFQIIGEGIKQAINSLLPMNIILNKFLNINDETYNNSRLLDIDFSNINFNTNKVQTAGAIDNQEELKKESLNNSVTKNNDEILNIINKNLKVSESSLNVPINNQNGGNNTDSTIKKRHSQKYNSSRKSSSTPDRNSRYSSKHNSSRRESSRRFSDDKNSSSTLKKIINNSINNSIHKSRTATVVDELSIDSKIKQHLMKDLESDTLTYNPENKNEDYQDVFSNSDVKEVVEKNNSKLKNKELFYSKYLDIE